MSTSKQKRCPICGFVTDKPQFVYCPNCEDGQVKLVELGFDFSMPSEKEELEEIQNKQLGDNSENSTMQKKVIGANTALGTGNAISGGIHNNTSVNDESVTTINVHKTTINKSVAEILVESRKVYRSRCKDLYYDGYITDDGLKELEELRCSLDLDPTIASAIRDEVKALSIKIRTELPLAGKVKLENLQIAISQNNTEVITNIVPELKGWMERVRSNELCYIYYQLNAILYPAKYIKDLLTNTSEDYWKTYWSYIAYELQGLNAKAETSLAELTAWDSFYPQQNQVLLLVIGYLMSNDTISARLAYSKLTVGVSKELATVRNAIAELLEADYSSKHIVSMSGGTTFYARNLFPKIIESIEIRIKENKAQEIEEEATQQRIQNQIRYQKESLLQRFQEIGQIEKACQEMGVAYHTFNIWLEEDAIFASSYRELLHCIEIKRNENAEKERKQREREIATREKKSNFKTLFEQNRCNLLKTCFEVSISSTDYQEWRKTDAAFNNDIEYIIRKNQEIIEEQKKQKRKEIYRKIQPFVFAIIVLGIIAFSINLYLTNKEDKAKIELTQIYKSKTTDFNATYKLIDSSPDGLDALSKAYGIVKDIRQLENSEYFVNTKESSKLIDKLQQKSDDLLDIFKKRVTLPEESGGNEIIWEDGRKGVEKIRKLQKSLSL